jgi:hypothetical protein
VIVGTIRFGLALLARPTRRADKTAKPRQTARGAERLQKERDPLADSLTIPARLRKFIPMLTAAIPDDR